MLPQRTATRQARHAKVDEEDAVVRLLETRRVTSIVAVSTIERHPDEAAVAGDRRVGENVPLAGAPDSGTRRCREAVSAKRRSTQCKWRVDGRGQDRQVYLCSTPKFAQLAPGSSRATQSRNTRRRRWRRARPPRTALKGRLVWLWLWLGSGSVVRVRSDLVEAFWLCGGWRPDARGAALLSGPGHLPQARLPSAASSQTAGRSQHHELDDCGSCVSQMQGGQWTRCKKE